MVMSLTDYKSGYHKKISGRNRNHLVVDDEALAAVDAELIERSGPGSCFQCSTLTDTTGLCQVRAEGGQGRSEAVNTIIVIRTSGGTTT